MNKRLSETSRIKKALTDIGYECSVRHGRGTGWNWITVNIKYRKWNWKERARLSKLAKTASGRKEPYEILVQYDLNSKR